MLLGAIGGPLLQGALTGTALGALSATQLGAGIAGLTSLAQGKDILSAGLDAFGGYGGAGAISNLAKTGAAAAGNVALEGASKIPSMGVADKILGSSAPAASLAPSTLQTAASSLPAPMGTFEAAGAGLKDLLSPGGSERFAELTGKSALSSVGVPAAGAVLGLTGGMAPQQGAAPQRSFGFGNFTPISEIRNRYADRMGYAQGGIASLNPMMGVFDARNANREFGEQMGMYAKGGEVEENSTDDRLKNLARSIKYMAGPIPNILDALAPYYSQGFSGVSGNTARPERINLGAFGDIAKALKPYYGDNSTPLAKGGYLDGPGDGMSDSISATIEGKQPARLADGEFVVPADVVSHLGNGSTKAGAQRLYSMMDKVRKARTGSTKQGKQIKPEKYMPA
jgi:hypothetical protein